MLKEASKILEIILEFCRENMNMVMIAGVALILLVLIISLARASKEEKLVDEKKPASEVISVQQPQRTAEVEAEPEAKAETNTQVEHRPVKEFTKNTMSLGAIVEELAEITGEGVKKVEIKIPGAEVKITYLDKDEEESCKAVSSGGESSEKELLEKTQYQVEQPGENTGANSKIENETAPAIKKFGPNNMNVTRSGKVFSEEELQEQIRD